VYDLIAVLPKYFGASSEWIHHYHHVLTTAFVCLLLLTFSLIAHKKLKNTEKSIVPEKKLSFANIFEFAVEQLLGLMHGIMGNRADRYFPLIAALFLYLFVSNLMGVIPGLTPPTENVNTNLACSLVVFLYYNYVGIKEQGAKHYFQHLLGPVAWLAPLMLIVEVISHVVRPISLCVRLFGNITGDHLVLGIFSDLVPLVVPVIFMALAIFVSFIQAFVFSLLSVIYISLASEEEAH